MCLCFIDALINKLFVIYIVCQMLSFNNLKLLFVLIYQKSLYFICDNYNNYVFFVVLV